MHFEATTFVEDTDNYTDDDTCVPTYHRDNMVQQDCRSPLDGTIGPACWWPCIMECVKHISFEDVFNAS